jgi:predicted nucleotidyltransferase
MDKAEALNRLRAREADLRSMGIEHLALFGSTARGDQRDDSDVDLAATLARDRKIGVFELIRIEMRLAELLGVGVDLVTEPSDATRLQHNIDRDRLHVF